MLKITLLACLLIITLPAFAQTPEPPTLEGELVFGSNRDGIYSIYTMTLPAGEVTRLTEGEDYKPIWSPDGTQIVFVSLRDAGDPEVYLMDADGENEHRLTESEGFDEPSGWSLDGAWIYFISNRDGAEVLYQMDMQGENLTALVDEDGNPTGGMESADGKYFAFTDDPDGNVEIFIQDIATGELVNLSNNPQRNDGSFAWSPSGEQMLWVANRVGSRNTDIFIKSIAGDAEIQVTDDFAAQYAAAWLDESHILFMSDETGDFEIYLLDLATSEKINLSNDPSADDGSPLWRPTPVSEADVN